MADVKTEKREQDKQWESRLLVHGDPSVVVVGCPEDGYRLIRGFKERHVALAGDNLNRAYFNAAMGLMMEKDWDALFARPKEPKREPVPGLIYFIGGEIGAVKIGFAVNPDLRIRDLQCGSPIPLKILATTPGMPKLEREYHKRFAAHRLHGEWFERHLEIQSEIDRLNGGAA